MKTSDEFLEELSEYIKIKEQEYKKIYDNTHDIQPWLAYSLLLEKIEQFQAEQKVYDENSR